MKAFLTEYYTPPPPPKSNNSALKIVGVVLAVVIIIGVFIVALPSLQQAGKNVQNVINPTPTPEPTPPPPDAVITSHNLRTGTSGLDYIAYVDVSVHNYGGPGTVVVWAKITQGSDQWTKSISMYMEQQGSKDVTLTFSEVGMWNLDSIQSFCWIG